MDGPPYEPTVCVSEKNYTTAAINQENGQNARPERSVAITVTFAALASYYS
jgi:hypothetical protein